MLTLSDSTLVALPYLNGSLTAIAQDEQWRSPPVSVFRLGVDPDSALDSTLITAVVSGNEATFTAGSTIQRIEQIEQDGVIYTLAADPLNPVAGEFVYDSITGAVRVISGGQMPTTPLQVISAEPLNVMAADLPISDLALLPDIFAQFELTGDVTWSSDWEGHPTGSFELVCNWAAADVLEQTLIPQRTSLMMFGVGFEVAALSITKESPLTNPALEAKVSVSLRGKWERLLGEEVVLDSASATASGVTTGNATIGAAVPVGGRTIRGNTTVNAIAALIGVPLQFPPTLIPAPTESGNETILSLSQAIEDSLRHHGCFADYSQNQGVRSRSLKDTPIHVVSYFDLVDPEFEIGVNAYPRAFDYKNSPLDWGQAAGDRVSGEDTQGKQQKPPQWRQQPPKRELVTTGAPTLDAPSDIDTRTKSGGSGSYVFDNGGPTREQKTVYTENGAMVRQSSVKMGFAAVACDDLYSYDASTGKWTESNGLLGTWMVIERLETTYTYDGSTGYLINISTTGSRKTRLKKEGSNESLAAYSAWIKATENAPKAKKAALLGFYRFKDVAVTEETVFRTERLRDYFNDVPPGPTEEWQVKEPKLLPDGRLNPATMTNGFGVSRKEVVENGITYVLINAKIPVPGYTEPQFCSLEVSRKYSFISAPDPDSTEKKPLPDLVSGEDKEVERAIYVRVGKNTTTKDTGALIETDTYIEHERIQTRKDSKFGRTALESTQQQNKGRPGEHTRYQKQYEKIDPEAENDNKGNLPNELEYRISTLPIDDIRLVGGGQSYDYANSLGQALTGATTDFEINNTRDTKTTKIEVSWALGAGIEPGDRINLEGHGLWRVINYAKGLEILTPGQAKPKTVELSLGKIPAEPQMTVQTIAKASENGQSPGSASTTVTGGGITAKFNSGDLIVK